MTDIRDQQGQTKYFVEHRVCRLLSSKIRTILRLQQPIHLDLLTLTDLTDQPLRVHDPAGRTGPSELIFRSLYSFTCERKGHKGGQFVLYAESAAIREEWKVKLKEALLLRDFARENSAVFRIENKCFIASNNPTNFTWTSLHDTLVAKITCIAPFRERTLFVC